MRSAFGLGMAACLVMFAGAVHAQLTDPYAGQATAAVQGFNQSLQRQWEQQQYLANLRAQRAAQAAEAAAAQEEADRAQAATATEENAEHDRQARSQQAGQMIAAGQCDQALSYALNMGDLDLATKVKTLCPAAASAAGH